MTPLERIIERINRNGDVEDPYTLHPLLTLEEFFDGNDSPGCICCNLTPPPSPQQVYELLKILRSKSNVADVRVQVTQWDEGEWPFSDTVWIITSATSDEVRSWFPPELAPDETSAGWRASEFEAITVPTGMTPISCWYD